MWEWGNEAEIYTNYISKRNAHKEESSNKETLMVVRGQAAWDLGRRVPVGERERGKEIFEDGF